MRVLFGYISRFFFERGWDYSVGSGSEIAYLRASCECRFLDYLQIRNTCWFCNVFFCCMLCFKCEFPWRVLWRLMARLCPLCRCYRWTWRNAWWTPIPAFALTGWWRLSAPLDTTWRPPCCTSSGRSETRPTALDSEQTDRLLCTSTAPLKHPLLWIYVYTHLHWTFIDEHPVPSQTNRLPLFFCFLG